MKVYVISRIIQALIMILVAIAFSFFLFRILPGDPTTAICGDPRVPAQTREILYKVFGLDKPLHEQFLVFLINTFKGNLGISFQYKVPIVQLLIRRLWNTMILLIPATLLSIFLGIIMGIIAAWFRGRLIDKIVTSMATMFWSTPSFWGGMVMIYLFAVTLRLFPAVGIVGWSNIGEMLHHLLLPMITYGVIFSGQYALVLRDTLSEVLAEDFILLAKAKGLTKYEVLRKHGFKNALLPLVTMIGLNLGSLILGSITIETVFTWPGVGRLIYEAVCYNDFPILQGVFFFFTIVMILLTVAVDILYAYLDPRVRLG